MGVVVEMSGDDAKVMQSIAKLEAKLKGVEGKLREVGRTAKRTSKDTSTGFAKVSGSLKGIVAQYAGWQVGISLVKAAHRSMIEEAVRGVNRLVSLHEPYKQIRQISGSLAEFQQTRALIQKSAGEEGLPEATVARMYFTAASAGVADQWKAILKGSRFLAPEAAAEAIGTFRSPQVFGPEVAGTGEQILSKLTRAAAESKFNVSEMIQGALLTATGAGRLGGGPRAEEELLGVLSATSQSFVSVERQSTAILAVLSTLAAGIPVKGAGGVVEQVRFDQAGILAGFEKLRTEHSDAYQNLMDTNKRFAEGALAIERSFDVVPALIDQIERENSNLSALRMQMDLWRGDKPTSTVTALQTSREQVAQAERDLAGERAKDEIELNNWLVAHMREEGTGLLAGFQRLMARGMVGAGFDPPHPGYGRESGAAERDAAALQKIAENTERIDANTYPSLVTPVDAVGNEARSEMN